MPMNLILASSSPRRQELLRAARIPFTAEASNIPEDPLPGERPLQFSERLAVEKAKKVWSSSASHNAVVLAADTIVVVDQQILNKPVDSDDAVRMLRLISGRRHEVTTSVCLLGMRIEAVRSETTMVEVTNISEDEIREYVATGEPMDKAGAYAIQGMASRWIPRIEGDYANVVGLPIALVYQMLAARSLKLTARN
jgi:septum formation protein